MPGLIKFQRAAKEFFVAYFMDQSLKAYDGLFMPISFEMQKVKRDEGHGLSRSLRKLAGVKLSAEEARVVWPRVLEHKWYLGERLGRDVGLRVAAADYFENIRPTRARALRHTRAGGYPPRLPMMRSVGQML
jgi:hypothetical protein